MTQPREIDYLIIGAGPAGLQLAYFLQRAGRDYLILDAADRAGKFFESFPRHDKLLSINKVFTGYEDREAQLRYDWNSLISDDEELAFTQYTSEYFPSARQYARYLRDYAERLALHIQFHTKVAKVEQLNSEGANYLVTDHKGDQYACRALVVATGLSRPYTPDIRGIEHAENYWDCSIDPADYADQRVLVIGKGNSAFETANHLTHVTRVTHLCSPQLNQAWRGRRHFFGHLRAVNNDFLDTYVLKGQNSVLDATIDRIEKVDGEYLVDITYTHADGQKMQTGVRPGAGVHRIPLGPELSSATPPSAAPCPRRPTAAGCRMMTSAWESTNLPHIYYAGTLMQMRDQHKTMSNVLHGFRFNVQIARDDPRRAVRGLRLGPAKRAPADCPEAMADYVIERVSTNAGLMHQPGFLTDVMVVSEDAKAEYHETHWPPTTCTTAASARMSTTTSSPWSMAIRWTTCYRCIANLTRKRRTTITTCTPASSGLTPIADWQSTTSANRWRTNGDSTSIRASGR